MAYTTPSTRAYAYKITAANWNELVDDIVYIKGQVDKLYVTVYNNDANTLVAGDVVILDKSYTSGLGVCLTTTAWDMHVFGVVTSASISTHATGLVAVGGTIENINVNGAVVFGHALVASATSHRAVDSGGAGWGPGVVGFALAANASGNATISALIKPYPLLYAANQIQINSYTKTNVPTGAAANVIDNFIGYDTYGNRLLLCLEHNNGVADTFTFDSAALTSLQDGTATKAYFGYLIAPNVTTANIKGHIATNTGGAIAIIMNGIHQTAPIGTFANSHSSGNVPASLTVSCVPGDYVIGCIISTSNVTIDSGRAPGQTNIQDILSTDNRRITMDYIIATGNSVTFTWNLSSAGVWDAVGVAVKTV